MFVSCRHFPGSNIYLLVLICPNEIHVNGVAQINK